MNQKIAALYEQHLKAFKELLNKEIKIKLAESFFQNKQEFVTRFDEISKDVLEKAIDNFYAEICDDDFTLDEWRNELYEDFRTKAIILINELKIGI